jgi:hypothetical protein
MCRADRVRSRHRRAETLWRKGRRESGRGIAASAAAKTFSSSGSGCGFAPMAEKMVGPASSEASGPQGRSRPDSAMPMQNTCGEVR